MMRPTDTLRLPAEHAVSAAVRAVARGVVDPLGDTGEYPAPPPIELPLRRGHRGQEVTRLQLALRIEPDGDFGPATERAVRAHQAAAGIGDPPGVAGALTQRSLGCELLPGIDVSHWQGDIDWSAVRAAGVQWVAVKVSEGDEPAKRAREYLDGAASVGLPRMGYHFGDARWTARDNVAAVAESLGGRYLELGHVLDVEQRTLARSWGASSREAARRYLRWTLDVGRMMADAYDRQPGLYTSESMIRGPLGGGAGLGAAFWLWQKQYSLTVQPPPNPRYWHPEDHVGPDAPGDFSEWLIWQCGNDARVQWGVRGAASKRLDGNWMAGGAMALLMGAA